MGKLSCDIIFSQIQQVELQMDEVHILFDEQYSEAYYNNFSVITFNKIFESTKSKSRIAKINPENGQSSVDWIYNIGNHPAKE